MYNRLGYVMKYYVDFMLWDLVNEEIITKKVEFDTIQDIYSVVKNGYEVEDIAGLVNDKYELRSINTIDWFINIVNGTSLTVAGRCVKMVSDGKAYDLEDAFEQYMDKHPRTKVKHPIDFS